MWEPPLSAVVPHVAGVGMVGKRVVVGGPGGGGKGGDVMPGRLVRCAVFIDVPIMPVGDVGAQCVWAGRYICCCERLSVTSTQTTAAKGCGNGERFSSLSLPRYRRYSTCRNTHLFGSEIDVGAKFLGVGRPGDHIKASEEKNVNVANIRTK